MIRPDQIPPEVVVAARQAASQGDWRVVLSHAINAWPGAYDNGPRKNWQHHTPAIILPLPAGDGQ